MIFQVFLEVRTKVRTKIFGWMDSGKVRTDFGDVLGQKVGQIFETGNFGIPTSIGIIGGPGGHMA